MYHKSLKIAISALSVVMAIVLFVQPTKAASVDFTFDYSALHHVNIDYSPTSIGTDISDISQDENSTPIITYPMTFSIDFYQSAYESQLYNNGVLRISINIPIFFQHIHPVSTNIDFNFTSECKDGVHAYIGKLSYYQAQAGPYLRINAYCVLDNAYVPSKLTGSLANLTVNVNINAIMEQEPQLISYRCQIGNATFDNDLYKVTTSVHPQTTSGQAGIMSDAFLFAIQQSYLEENQETANQNLSTIISWLSTIKAQDLNYYNQIVQKIAEQTANDNRLFEILYNTLQSDLYGDHSLSTPWGEADFHGFAGDLLAQIGVEVAYFRMLFNSYARANQTEAEEVNDAAASQEEALNSLADSLAVPTRDFNSNFDSLDNEFSEDIVSDQGRLFFFLHPRYNIIITILVTATSFGLIGFILYGKGG